MEQTAITPANKLKTISDKRLQWELNYFDKKCRELIAQMEHQRTQPPEYKVHWKLLDAYATVADQYQATMEEIQRRHIP